MRRVTYYTREFSAFQLNNLKQLVKIKIDVNVTRLLMYNFVIILTISVRFDHLYFFSLLQYSIRKLGSSK